MATSTAAVKKAEPELYKYPKSMLNWITNALTNFYFIFFAIEVCKKLNNSIELFTDC